MCVCACFVVWSNRFGLVSWCVVWQFSVVRGSVFVSVMLTSVVVCVSRVLPCIFSPLLRRASPESSQETLASRHVLRARQVFIIPTLAKLLAWRARRVITIPTLAKRPRRLALLARLVFTTITPAKILRRLALHARLDFLIPTQVPAVSRLFASPASPENFRLVLPLRARVHPASPANLAHSVQSVLTVPPALIAKRVISLSILAFQFA
jgi:hypothetical protein